MEWQAIVATVIVIAAALWLVRRMWRIIKSGSRGGGGDVVGCGTCHKNPDVAEATPLVQLGKNSKS
jgi:hypothetical protein